MAHRILLQVDELTSVKDNHSRCRLLEEWHKAGGCMIMGYEMYRNLSTLRNIKKAKQKKIITSALIEPGVFAFINCIHRMHPVDTMVFAGVRRRSV